MNHTTVDSINHCNKYSFEISGGKNVNICYDGKRQPSLEQSQLGFGRLQYMNRRHCSSCKERNLEIKCRKKKRGAIEKKEQQSDIICGQVYEERRQMRLDIGTVSLETNTGKQRPHRSTVITTVFVSKTSFKKSGC